MTGASIRAHSRNPQQQGSVPSNQELPASLPAALAHLQHCRIVQHTCRHRCCRHVAVGLPAIRCLLLRRRLLWVLPIELNRLGVGVERAWKGRATGSKHLWACCVCCAVKRGVCPARQVLSSDATQAAATSTDGQLVPLPGLPTSCGHPPAGSAAARMSPSISQSSARRPCLGSAALSAAAACAVVVPPALAGMRGCSLPKICSSGRAGRVGWGLWCGL